MRIEHIALYVRELASMRDFYATFFGGVPNDGYHNPTTGLCTYFLTFEDGARLELMTRPELGERAAAVYPPGWAHLAFQLTDRTAVDALTERLRAAGCSVVSGPRVTGDGYYESCVRDPEGNLVEITA